MADARNYNVPEAQSPTTWANDLCNALAPALPNWTITFLMINRTAIDAGNLTYQYVAAQAQDAWLHLHPRRSGGTKAAFPAFTGSRASGSEVNHSEAESESEAERPRGRTPSRGKRGSSHGGSRGGSARGRGAAQSRGSKRRRADTNEQDQCEACHGDHPLMKCYYAFPEKAYNRWTPNPGMKALVRHKISTTPDLKEKIERFQKRQKQDDDQE